MRKLVLLAAASAVLLGGCEFKSKSRAENGATATSAEAEKVVAGIEKSWSSGSTDAVMANYAPDAVVFFTDSIPPSADRNFLTRSTAGFVTMKPGDFVITDRHIQQLDDDTIVSSGLLSFTAQVGSTRPVLKVRFTQVIEKQADDRWLIVHEHMSLPPEPIVPPAAGQ